MSSVNPTSPKISFAYAAAAAAAAATPAAKSNADEKVLAVNPHALLATNASDAAMDRRLSYHALNDLDANAFKSVVDMVKGVDILNLAQVNRKFRTYTPVNMARFLEKAPIKSLSLSPQQLISALKLAGPHLTKLNLSGIAMHAELLETVVRHCKNLARLDFSYETEMPLRLDFSYVPERLSDQVSILNYALLQNLAKLIEVNITPNKPYSEPDDWHHIHARFDFLSQQLLGIAQSVGLKIKSFEAFDRTAPDLKQSMDGLIDQLVTHCPNLNSLSLIYCRLLNPKLDQLTQLKELSLKRSIFQKDSLMKWMQNLATLEILDLSHCTLAFSDADANNLPQNNRLRVVHAQHAKEIDANFLVFLQKASQLEELSIEGVNLKPDWIVPISQLAKLQKLSFLVDSIAQDVEYSPLQQLRHLAHIDCYVSSDIGVCNANLYGFLGSAPALTSLKLKLQGFKLVEGELTLLSDAPQLEHLSLPGKLLIENDFEKLKNLPKLKALNIERASLLLEKLHVLTTFPSKITVTGEQLRILDYRNTHREYCQLVAQVKDFIAEFPNLNLSFV